VGRGILRFLRAGIRPCGEGQPVPRYLCLVIGDLDGE
jgi:hypothetical protein